MACPLHSMLLADSYRHPAFSELQSMMILRSQSVIKKISITGNNMNLMFLSVISTNKSASHSAG
jgi:hypothetical protein